MASLLEQVWHMRGSDYPEWVNEKPDNSRESKRLLPCSSLEFLSKTPWYLIPILWCPAAVYLYTGSTHPHSSLYAAGGILGWTFLEYLLHRCVFHMEDRLPVGHRSCARTVRTFHFLIHGIHHKFPRDRYRLVFPPTLAALILAVLLLLFQLLDDNLMTYTGGGEAVSRAFPAGLLLGYVYYDVWHYASHTALVKNIPILRYQAQYHMEHHYRKGGYEKKFGVTSPLWDVIGDSYLANQ